jgi:uncharacterized protein YjbJ (UPF0337 family)
MFKECQGTFKEHSGNIQGMPRHIQGTFREYSGNAKEHSGNVQASLVRLFWGFLGPQVDSPPMKPGVVGGLFGVERANVALAVLFCVHRFLLVAP